MLHFLLNSWFRASWLYINKIQQDATVRRCLFTAKLLYMQLQFDVLLMMGAIDTRNM